MDPKKLKEDEALPWAFKWETIEVGGKEDPTTEEALKKVVETLEKLAEALRTVAEEAKKAGEALKGIREVEDE